MGVNATISYSNPQETEMYPIDTVASWICGDETESATCERRWSGYGYSYTTAFYGNNLEDSECGKYA